MRDQGGDPVVIFISRMDGRVLSASARLAASMGLRVAGTLAKPVSPGALRVMLRDAPPRVAAPSTAGEPPPGAEELAAAPAVSR